MSLVLQAFAKGSVHEHELAALRQLSDSFGNVDVSGQQLKRVVVVLRADESELMERYIAACATGDTAEADKVVAECRDKVAGGWTTVGGVNGGGGSSPLADEIAASGLKVTMGSIIVRPRGAAAEAEMLNRDKSVRGRVIVRYSSPIAIAIHCRVCGCL